jgi:hypothetical protein
LDKTATHEWWWAHDDICATGAPIDAAIIITGQTQKEDERRRKLQPASIHSLSIPRGNGAIRDFIQSKEKGFRTTTPTHLLLPPHLHKFRAHKLKLSFFSWLSPNSPISHHSQNSSALIEGNREREREREITHECVKFSYLYLPS